MKVSEKPGVTVIAPPEDKWPPKLLIYDVYDANVHTLPLALSTCRYPPAFLFREIIF